jgi:transposase
VDPRDQRIAELETVVEEKQAASDALTAKVEQLEAVVAELLEKLNQNSRNSHLPPSSDGPGTRTGDKPKGKGERKGKKNRKRGGQPGHRGHHRELLPPDRVDHIVDHFPAECEDCGASLPKAEDHDPIRTQETEVPPMQPVVTEHRQHAVTCACGCTTRAKPGLPASPFGPRLMSLIVLFTGVYHLSRRQTVTVLNDVLGTKISLGAISAVEGRVSAALAPAADEAWEQVDDAPVKHTDATSWLHNGKTRTLWTLATAVATVFKIVVDGSAATIKPFFGACKGILVSDRATVFTFWRMKYRQICWAHLIRKFISFSERDGPAGKLGEELLEYTELLFDYWHSYRDGELSKKQFLDWMAPVRKRLEDCLQRAVDAGIKHVSGSCSDILKHRQALWTYLSHKGVEPTNNHAEQELRAFVLWRKTCFGAQSERGHEFAARVMTVAHTARKQNRNVLNFLTDSCEAWRNGTPSPSLFKAEPAAA